MGEEMVRASASSFRCEQLTVHDSGMGEQVRGLTGETDENPRESESG